MMNEPNSNPDPSAPKPMAGGNPLDNSTEFSQHRSALQRLLEETGSFEQTPHIDETTSFDRQNQSAKTVKLPADEMAPLSIGGYTIKELLGHGGMGKVFRAEDSSGSAVALKLLSPKLARSDDALARFKQEGLIASQINHPQIVFVHRVDEDQGTPFIAMELMTGKTLKDLVLERGRLTCRESVELTLQCIDGLMEAHSKGMIHRDIKPANCYLDEDGYVKIGDFGLARSLITDSELTQTGAFLGTPLFASPEQLLGQTLDERSDIYSLTATLYYLIAGKAPFESPNAAQAIARIASSDPPSFSSIGVEVPPSLEAIVMKGLSRDANERYSSFTEMRDELNVLLAPKPEAPSLGRRVIAGIADSFISTTLLGVIILFVLSPLTGRSEPPTELIGMLMALLYYWISESLFGTSLGKAALRVRVVDRQTGTKPSSLKCLLRAVVFLAVVHGIGWMANSIMAYSGIDTPLRSFAVGWLAMFAGFGLCYSTWKKSGNKHLLHDWLSKTECQFKPVVQMPLTTMELPDWSPSRIDAPSIPHQLGRFEVRNEIVPLSSHTGVRWFEGADPQLGRKVWLALSSDPDLDLEAIQQSRPRWNRVRFIEEGRIGSEHWFCYATPAGLPLSQCLSQSVHFPWPQTRSVFSQLEELSEVSQCMQGEHLPTSDKLWIDRAGRLSVVDFDDACTEGGGQKSEVRGQRSDVGNQTSESGEEPWDRRPRLSEYSEDGCPTSESSAVPSDLIKTVCTLALSPSHRFRKRQLKCKATQCQISVESMLPLRAMKLCESVAAGKYEPTLPQALEDIRKVSNSSPAISTRSRFFSAALSCAFLLPWLVASWVLLALPCFFYLHGLDEDVRCLKTLDYMTANQRTVLEDDWAGATAEQRMFCRTARGAVRIKEAIEAATEKLVLNHDKLGTIEKALWSQAAMAGDNLLSPNRFLLSSETKKTDRNDQAVHSIAPPISIQAQAETDSASTASKLADSTKDEPIIEIKGSNSSRPMVISVGHSEWSPTQLQRAMNLAHSGPTDNPHFEEQMKDYPSFAIWIILGAGAVWTWVTLGGVSQYLCGICYVRRDGRRIGFLMGAIRAVLLYLPFVVVAYLIINWNLTNEHDLFWTTQLKRLFLLLPLIYLATTTFRGNRTPLDKLTGTVAIPR